MNDDLDPLLKRLHLANTRRTWRNLVERAEKEQWAYTALLQTLFAEEVAHRRGTRLARAVRAAAFPSCGPSTSSISPTSPRSV